MSSVANIADGVVTNTDTTAVTSTKSTSSNSALDKDAFLQLLVAEMKYQDPLEPTSNTEYIAQYAQLSQVESINNMANSMEQSNALQLVGKYVTLEVEGTGGETSSVSGRVDYVEKSGTKTLLYIDGVPYNYDNLATVWDEDYLEAYDLGQQWGSAVTSLPSAENITLNHKGSIETLREAYNNMTVYQKSFIGSSLVTKLEEAEARIAALEKAAASAAAASESSKETDSEAAESDETTENQTE